ncbi:hypothetical protein DCC85_21715 [Paenibacillus sp. CAA11]|uniref:hypothetical protein n=1 Tax=Paenibacillus sp. CAA11 TaxID=1532905 RepID=UPI000D3A989B|nr:hypothetical protein [Paenibacillus sp. CAA11]AWB46527.1 hypothetical protein DCC85_21715 [Paenibacillus sp. CAA11]
MENQLGPDWMEVAGRTAAILEEQAQREVGPDHALYGHVLRAVVKSEANDAVLFEDLSHPQFVLVHLTWSGTQAAGYPRFVSFSSYEDFIAASQRTGE